MAESSRFHTTNNTGDGPSAGYSAANFGQFIRETFMTNPAAEGVLYGIGNNLAVSGTSSPVAVNTGAALNYGVYYTNDSSVNVTIPTPSSATRIDRVVLRYSWSAQTVRITRIAGTEGSGSAPALTQTANTTWDIPLANVSITTGGVCTVSDQRTYVKHPGVYGWLQQANTWTGNQTITGALTVSGTASASTLQIDSNFYAQLSSGNPLLSVDTNDWIDYQRSTNQYRFVVGGALAAAVDSSGLNASQLGSGTVPLARLSGITTAQLAADSVDDTIVGNRVPQFYRRQGGSATDWNTAGTTTCTPTAVRMQSGTSAVTFSASSTGSVSVTFPTSFSAKPQVYISNEGGTTLIPSSQSVTGSGFTLYAVTNGGGNISATVNFNWLAIGPE